MDENEFNNKLRELIDEIADLPKDKQEQLKPLVDETKKRHKDIKEDVSNISRSLTDLRICFKYMLFDLEATKRERDDFEAKLNKQKPKNDPNQIDGEM